MPLVRMIVSCKPNATSDGKDAFVNTLYFNVSGSVDPPNYQQLVNDLWAAWSLCSWSKGRWIDIRAYNMDDPKPRPVKARTTIQVSGTAPTGPRQVALCLSYYADRNLPRQRGRIFCGPWTADAQFPAASQTAELITLANALAGLGGLNVDWSLYSPTNGTNTRINHGWVDNSWDIIRSRKTLATIRTTYDING